MTQKEPQRLKNLALRARGPLNLLTMVHLNCTSFPRYLISFVCCYYAAMYCRYKGMCVALFSKGFQHWETSIILSSDTLLYATHLGRANWDLLHLG
jgi:hypothetical protein